MRTSSLVLVSVLALVAGCGGSTTSSTGQEQSGTGGAGGTVPAAGGSSTSLGQGGSVTAGGHGPGGTSNGGSSASTQGTGGVSPLGVGGSAPEGPGGSSPQGVGGAGPQGMGGSSAGTSSTGGFTTGGSGGSTSPPDWTTCIKPGDCLLEQADCCGFCGPATVSDYDSVDYLKLAEQQMDICANGTNGCPPHCAPVTNPDLAAFCTNNQCQVVQIHSDPISACSSDQDCELHEDTCCSCGQIDPGSLIAIRADQEGQYEAQVCGPNVGGCASDCAGAFPPGYVARCDTTTQHCAVAHTPTSATCPDVAPIGGTACSLSSNVQCEYGDDVRVDCRIHAECSNGQWELAEAGCPPVLQPGQGSCPSTEAAADGMACGNDGDVCDFGGENSCDCVTCAGGFCMPGAMPMWVCGGPSNGCPLVANTGQPCMMEGQSCMYGPACTADGIERVCNGGVWVDEPIACGG